MSLLIGADGASVSGERRAKFIRLVCVAESLASKRWPLGVIM